MSTPGPILDAARRLVSERGLVRAAFDHLTVDAFMTLPFEAMAPTKTLLKRFFSSEPWTAADDEDLATTVGPGEGRWQRELDSDLVLEYGWAYGRFGVRVSADSNAGSPDPSVSPAGPATDQPLAAAFDGPVVPEATPNPRTIRFQVGPIHDGPSRWYESAGSVGDDDPGVARLFARFGEVANVLVGSDFVAVGLRRAADWERLLRPVLAVVTQEFASADTLTDASNPASARTTGGPAGVAAASAQPGWGGGAPVSTGGRGPQDPGAPRQSHRLERAWRDLGGLRPAHADDLVRVRAAAGSDDPSNRQVAASLLREADAAVAAGVWARLAGDPARSVRRAAVDAMVDVEREELRPLLEKALGDGDPWIRWKALRGLVELGSGPSSVAISTRVDDPDFHVRLEAAAALRGDPP